MRRLDILRLRSALLVGVACLLAGSVTAQNWVGPGSLGLTVKSGKGKPLAGAVVTIAYREIGFGDGPSPRQTTDGGEAAFVGLAEGAWSLKIDHPDYLSYLATVIVRRGKKTEVLSEFLEATGAGRLTMRVKLDKSASESLGKPVEKERLADSAPPASVPRQAQSERKESDALPSPGPKPSAPPVSPPVKEPPVPTPAEQRLEETPATESIAIEPPSPPALPAPEPESTAARSVPISQPVEDSSPPPGSDPNTEPVSESAPVAEPTAPADIKPKTPAKKQPAPEPVSARPEPEMVEPVETPPAPVEVPNPVVEEATVAVEAAAPSVPEREPTVIEPQPKQAPTQQPAAATSETPSEPRSTTFEPATKPEADQEAESPAAIAPPRGNLTSFKGGTCLECRPGEWAITTTTRVEALSASACDVTPEAVSDQLRLLAKAAADRLRGYWGPLPTEVLSTPSPLTSLVEDDSCRLVVVVIPGGAHYSGFRLQAQDSGGEGDCVPERPCPIQNARWLFAPATVDGEGTTLVFSVFRNTAITVNREATLTAYFLPPEGWKKALPGED